MINHKHKRAKSKMVTFEEDSMKTDALNTETREKTKKPEILGDHVKGMKEVVKKLEISVAESESDEKRLMLQFSMDDLKKTRTGSQLENAKKENKQLLNILQQKCSESDMSRSQIDMSSSYSTMSIVNLQYKYEELLASYEGLLKVMVERDKDMHKSCEENESLKNEMDKINLKLHDCERSLKKMAEKYSSLKQRKDSKINELRRDKETLRLAHNQLVQLLHKQCTKNEELLSQQLCKAMRPERALLLQEVQRSNKLHHENMLLKQEIACLKSKCAFPTLKDTV